MQLNQLRRNAFVAGRLTGLSKANIKRDVIQQDQMGRQDYAMIQGSLQHTQDVIFDRVRAELRIKSTRR